MLPDLSLDKPCQERLEEAWQHGYDDFKRIGHLPLTMEHFAKSMSDIDWENSCIHENYWTGWLVARDMS